MATQSYLPVVLKVTHESKENKNHTLKIQIGNKTLETVEHYMYVGQTYFAGFIQRKRKQLSYYLLLAGI